MNLRNASKEDYDDALKGFAQKARWDIANMLAHSWDVLPYENGYVYLYYKANQRTYAIYPDGSTKRIEIPEHEELVKKYSEQVTRR